MEVQARPRSIRFTDDDPPPSESAKTAFCDENEGDDSGPMSPNLKLPAASSRRENIPRTPLSPVQVQDALSDAACKPRRPLDEAQKLEQRLDSMATLHAKTTAQLLRVQRDRYEADGRAVQQDAEFELLELRQELELKQAQCDSLQRALDTEVAAWTSRCAASEARTSALCAERASLAAEMHRLRLEADAAREGARREVEACTRRGDEQLDQLSRLFLVSTTTALGASPRTPVKPTAMDAKLSTPPLARSRMTPPLGRRAQ